MAYVKSNPKISAAIKTLKKLSYPDVRAHLDALGKHGKPLLIDQPDMYAAAMFLYRVGKPSTHTLDCLKSQRDDANRLARWVRQYQAFKRAWPQSCESCDATGARYEYNGEWEPSGWVDCDNCLGAGKCPRCGEVVFTGDEYEKTLECYLCGWTHESEQMPVAPERDFFCGCPRYLGE